MSNSKDHGRVYLWGRVIACQPSILENSVAFSEQKVLLVIFAGFFVVPGHCPDEVHIGIELNKLLKKQRGLSHAGGSEAGVFFFQREGPGSISSVRDGGRMIKF